jgi:Opioid growth factor receptor (OGFr) conserved region
MSAIVDFYRNGLPRPDGLTLQQIMSWSDKDMERSRNVFEWLFPLDHPTLDEPHAPILTEGEVALFKADPELRTALLKSLIRVLGLLGLRIDVTRGQIARAGDFDAKSGWLYPHNVNYIRLTRMLTSLNLLGLEQEAAWLFQTLQDIHETHGRYIGGAPMRYWRDAMGGRLPE